MFPIHSKNPHGFAFDFLAKPGPQVVVDIEPGRKFSLIDLASLRVLLCDIFGREADVIVREDLRPRFREEIEREAVRVL